MTFITETYISAKRTKVEAIDQEEQRKREAQLKQQQAEEENENRLLDVETTVRQKYQQQFDTSFPPKPFWNYWFGGSILMLISILIIFPNISGSVLIIPVVIGGAILGTFLQDYFEKKRKQSDKYITLEKRRDEELVTAREKVKNGVSVVINSSENLPVDILDKLKIYVGSEADESEIVICTQKVEKIISGLVTTSDCRKIAIATKIKLAVNAPKQNIIDMITKSFPAIITDNMAANIFYTLVDQS